ncbi:MAG: DUF1330 domain-containing protein [Pseudomonadales bacterium]|jgi:uncharacterized protein (DUF1330 family)
MTGKDHPSLLYMQIPAVLESAVYLADAESLASEFGGTTLASVDADAVECLEPGSPECAIFLIEFKRMEQLTAFWTSERNQSLLGALDSDVGLLALAVPGLPYSGLPDALEIPTTATVKPPEGAGPRAFMVIQGSVTDQQRIDQYRDVLLPMIAAADAYYTAFEIAGGLQVLVGEWSWEIFAISRWPDLAAGHTVWDSERYQTKAIPIRTGAGTFNVHFFNGLAG